MSVYTFVEDYKYNEKIVEIINEVKGNIQYRSVEQISDKSFFKCTAKFSSFNLALYCEKLIQDFIWKAEMLDEVVKK
jgi:hypothetical protein